MVSKSHSLDSLLHSQSEEGQGTELSGHYTKKIKRTMTASLFCTTKILLGWSSIGPPSCFQWEGKVTRKQEEIAEMQAQYYETKIKRINDE